MAAPFTSLDALPTNPAVSVAESAMSKQECRLTSTTTSHHGPWANKAMATPTKLPDAMTQAIHRRRPMRRANSLPKMEAGVEIKFTKAATAAADQGEAPALTPKAKTRKATVQAREPNNSKQCTP